MPFEFVWHTREGAERYRDAEAKIAFVRFELHLADDLPIKAFRGMAYSCFPACARDLKLAQGGIMEATQDPDAARIRYRFFPDASRRDYFLMEDDGGLLAASIDAVLAHREAKEAARVALAGLAGG